MNGFEPARLPAEDAGPGFQEDLSETPVATRSLPAMAVASVIHAVGLLAAAFVIYAIPMAPQLDPLIASTAALEVPPPPEEQEPPPVKNVEEVIVTEPVEMESIEDETEVRDENPTDSPLELMDNPLASDSPSPLVGPNNAFGFGGGGGGGPPGDGGGWVHRRGGGPPGRYSPERNRVNDALQWLADHQHPNGHWSASNFHADSIRPARGAEFTYNVDFRDHIARMLGDANRDGGEETFNSGLTGLALLAFLANGHTNKEGVFARNVGRATNYLLGLQDPEGCFGARDDEEFVYNHAICAMAVAELQMMAPHPKVRAGAQRAVDFIVRCQNPGAGWRYGVQPKQNDSSVTAWMVLALKSATLASLEFDYKTVYSSALAWYEQVTGRDENGYERTGYVRPVYGNARLAHARDYDMNPSMDACSVMVRLFTSEYSAGDRIVQNQSRLILSDMPTWYIGGDESKGPWKVDFYYWYYASLAMFQMGDNFWPTWESNLLHPVLMKYQRGFHPKDVARYGQTITAPAYVYEAENRIENSEAGRWKLDEHGSWDPIDPWGSAGGRVYATAVNALTMGVSYRYLRGGVH